jgi:hypothetical protein
MNTNTSPIAVDYLLSTYTSSELNLFIELHTNEIKFNYLDAYTMLLSESIDFYRNLLEARRVKAEQAKQLHAMEVSAFNASCKQQSSFANKYRINGRFVSRTAYAEYIADKLRRVRQTAINLSSDLFRPISEDLLNEVMAVLTKLYAKIEQLSVEYAQLVIA